MERPELVNKTPLFSKRLKAVVADMGYISGPLSQAIKKQWGAQLQIKKHPWQGDQRVRVKAGEEPPPAAPKPKGFVPLKMRWIVERSFAWLGRHRRHCKDQELLPACSEAFIRISFICNMLRSLTLA